MLKKLSLLGLSLMLAFYPTVALAAENDEEPDSEQEEKAKEATNQSADADEEAPSEAEDEPADEDEDADKEDKDEDNQTSSEEDKENSEDKNADDETSSKKSNDQEDGESEKADDDQVEEEATTEENEEEDNEEEIQTLADEEDEEEDANEQKDEDLDLSQIYGSANANNDSHDDHGITYDFNKGHYVLDLQAGLSEYSGEQSLNQKWVAFALPNGVYIPDVADVPSGILPVTLEDGHNGIAVKIPDVKPFPDSQYVYPKIPLAGAPDDNDPNENLYLLNADGNDGSYEILGQIKSQRDITFDVMEANPQLDLHGSIAGKAEFDNDKGYYMLDVAVKAQNQTDSSVNDLYAGFELPEGVEVLNNDDMPANVEMLNDDGKRIVALKLPELSTDSEREVNYQIPVLGESNEVVEASTINAYKIDDSYQPVGQYEGSISVDFSEMTEQWDFSAQSQIVKDFPGLDKDQFGLRFSFKTQNLTLDNVDKVKVEFKVPGDITVHEPDEYSQGSIPDSMKDFLGDNLGSGSLDLDWDGNTAIIDLETVDGMSGYEGFFTAFGESSKALNDLKGIEVLVTLYQNGDEVAKEINVPFEIVSYEGDETEEPEDPEKPAEPGNGDKDDDEDNNEDDGNNNGDKGNNEDDGNKNDDKGNNKDNGNNNDDKGNNEDDGNKNDDKGNNEDDGNKSDDKGNNKDKNDDSNVNVSPKNDGSDDNDDDSATISGTNDSDSDGSGWALPDTATNMFNLLLIGSTLIVAGGALILFRKRKLAQE